MSGPKFVCRNCKHGSVDNHGTFCHKFDCYASQLPGYWRSLKGCVFFEEKQQTKAEAVEEPA